MRNFTKILIFLLLPILLLSSCAHVTNEPDDAVEQEALIDEYDTEHATPLYLAKNDGSDLLMDSGKVIDIKNPSTLHSIVLPLSVRKIGEEAFSVCCLHLSWIDLPRAVERIGRGAFYKCTSLGTVLIENPQTVIEENAFDDCFSLRKIYFFGTSDEWKKISSACGECLDGVEIVCCDSLDDVDACYRAKESR